MTQNHPYIAKTQSWCMSLRILMGYPAVRPPFHTTSWCASGARDIFGAMQLTQVAAEMGQDLVHVAFALDHDEPLAVSLAVRRAHGIEWLPGCRLYAASETSKIELLTHEERWHIGPRLVLTSAKLPPHGRREGGEEIAWRRWRQQAAAMHGVELEGSLWVPEGGGYADAIPQEELKLAA